MAASRGSFFTGRRVGMRRADRECIRFARHAPCDRPPAAAGAGHVRRRGGAGVGRPAPAAATAGQPDPHGLRGRHAAGRARGRGARRPGAGPRGRPRRRGAARRRGRLDAARRGGRGQRRAGTRAGRARGRRGARAVRQPGRARDRALARPGRRAGRRGRRADRRAGGRRHPARPAPRPPPRRPGARGRRAPGRRRARRDRTRPPRSRAAMMQYEQRFTRERTPTLDSMRSRTERELKLAGGGAIRLADLDGEPIADRSFVSTYHDTPELTLAAAGITLRHRVEGTSKLWQLKLPQVRGRLEVELAGGSATVPARVRALLKAHLRTGRLRPVAALRTERAGVRMHAGHAGLEEVVRDSVVVLDGAAPDLRFEEIEVELLEGPARALRRVEALLRAAGAADGDGRPKLFQVLGIEPAAPPRPPLDRPATRLAAVVAEQYAAIMANDPGTRLGADPEHLHRHRVAVRRLRAMLRAAGAMLDPTWTRELRDELGLLGRMLGPVRDLDVLIEHLTGSAATLGDPDAAAAEPLLHGLGAERELARKVLLQALDSDRYLELLDRIKAAGEAPAVVDPYCALPELAEREYRKLARDARRIRPKSSDADLHALRIRGKRMRYAAELA